MRIQQKRHGGKSWWREVKANTREFQPPRCQGHQVNQKPRIGTDAQRGCRLKAAFPCHLSPVTCQLGGLAAWRFKIMRHCGGATTGCRQTTSRNPDATVCCGQTTLRYQRTTGRCGKTLRCGLRKGSTWPATHLTHKPIFLCRLLIITCNT